MNLMLFDFLNDYLYNTFIHTYRYEIDLWKMLLTSFYSRKLAGVTGLEPATSCVTGRRSNQLSYTPVNGGR